MYSDAHTKGVGNKWLLEQFIDWTNGGPAPVNTIDDHLQLMAMVFSVIESIETGRVVNTKEFMQQSLAEKDLSYRQITVSQ